MDQPLPPRDPKRRRARAVFVQMIRDVSGGWRRVVALALLFTAAVALVAGVYFFLLQSRRTVTTLPFQVMFEEKVTLSKDGRGRENRQLVYPNGLPFAPIDIIGASAVEQVYRGLNVSAFCEFEPFRRGLVVQEGALERRRLDATFEPLLSNVRLTPVERIQIEDQYQARIDALPHEYELMLISSGECDRIPSDVRAAALSGILESWAAESEQKRGVLRYDIPTVRPTVFDETNLGQPRIIRLDLLRRGIQRALLMADRLEKVPGAQAVRAQAVKMTLPEIRGRLLDLRVTLVETLMASESVAGASRWLSEARASARLQKEASQIRAEAFRKALREFSGAPQPVAASVTAPDRARPGLPGANAQADTQTLIPQLDSSFIDKIVELSTQSSEFREELTREMVDAEVEAVAFRSDEAFYESVLQGGGGAVRVDASVDQLVSGAIQEGRRLVSELNALYDEFSRVGMRSMAGLYRVAGGVRRTSSWPLGEFLEIVLWTLIVSLLVAGGVSLAQQHLARRSSDV